MGTKDLLLCNTTALFVCTFLGMERSFVCKVALSVYVEGVSIFKVEKT
jgi:hypothetical protein